MWVELKVKTQIILDSWRLCCCERKKRQFDSCCRAKFCCCESNRFWLSHIFHSSIHQCHASIGKSFLQRELNFVSTFGDFGVQRWRSIWFWLWFRTVRRQIFMSQTNSFVSTIYMEIQMVKNTVGENPQKSIIFASGSELWIKNSLKMVSLVILAILAILGIWATFWLL